LLEFRVLRFEASQRPVLDRRLFGAREESLEHGLLGGRLSMDVRHGARHGQRGREPEKALHP
jgi:hypothetical protein